MGALSESRIGAGASTIRDEAMLAAIGESVERYCASFQPDSLHTATWQDLSTQCSMIPVDAFNNLHSSQAAGFYRLLPNEPARWCAGQFADDRSRTYAPWSLVCLGATAAHRRAAECFPGPSISTGLACSDSYIKAVESSILECCERDAAMLAWYRRDYRGRLSIDALHELSPTISSELIRCNLEAHVLDVTTDVRVPSFVSAITARGDRRAAAFGMASGLRARIAASKALVESLHTWMWADYCRSRGMVTQLQNPGVHFPDFESRVVAYGSGIMSAELTSFFATVEASDVLSVVPSADDMASVNEAVQRMSRMGHRCVVIDLTTDDVRDLGLHVIRAICPTFQAMEACHDYRTVNDHRLLRSAVLCYTEVPHPYP